ncbi:MAG TPA: ATP-binding cassette domain-containing protein [Acidimicrobiia bacterium]|nr:ATP-binding cassette domain-containing protein [Acidimicrobiia bacterium]
MIEVRRLTKRYGETIAVDDLSFQVLPGRVTGFLGPNGAGKSTTMRVILGLDAPNAGTATVKGTPYGRHRFPAREVGALLDAMALHPGRSARAHLWSLAQSNRISRSRVDEVLDLVGLTDVARRRVGPFSLGMKQRLGIAAALLGDPEVLLFDEPVTGLDPEGIVWIRGLFHRLAADGRTVFVSSHLMSEMALTAQHLIVIGRGKLIADDTSDNIVAGGSTTVLVRSPRADELSALLARAGGSIGSDNGALSVTNLDAAAIGDLAAQHGIALHELTPQHASLEEVFFELTGDQVQYRAASPEGGPTNSPSPTAHEVPR